MGLLCEDAPHIQAEQAEQATDERCQWQCWHAPLKLSTKVSRVLDVQEPHLQQAKQAAYCDLFRLHVPVKPCSTCRAAHLTCSTPSRLRTSGASSTAGTRLAASAAPRSAIATAAERPFSTLQLRAPTRANTASTSLAAVLATGRACSLIPNPSTGLPAVCTSVLAARATEPG